MELPLALRRRVEPSNVPRPVDESLYKSDHFQKDGAFILSQARGAMVIDSAGEALQAAFLRPIWQG
jgi:hypothetical protein